MGLIDWAMYDHLKYATNVLFEFEASKKIEIKTK